MRSLALQPSKHLTWCTYKSYRALYDLSHRITWLVQEHLVIPDNPKPKVYNRPRFKQEKRLPKEARVTDADYDGEWARGHLARAGNHKVCHQAWRETFVYTNVSPQSPKINEGIWNRVERRVFRSSELRGSSSILLTGPIYFYVADYIGPQKLPVPSHFFKVAHYPTGETEAFVVKNCHQNDLTDSEKAKICPDELARVTGLGKLLRPPGQEALSLGVWDMRELD